MNMTMAAAKQQRPHAESRTPSSCGKCSLSRYVASMGPPIQLRTSFRKQLLPCPSYDEELLR